MGLALLFSKLCSALVLQLLEWTFCAHCDRLLRFLHGFLSEISLLVIPFFISIAVDTNSAKSFLSFWPARRVAVSFFYVIASAFLSLALISPGHCVRNPMKPVTVFDIVEALVNKCLLPSVCEEVVFRGWMFHVLKESMNNIAAGLLTALLFGLFHPWKSLVGTATIVLFSCCWTYANVDTDSLFPSMAGHFNHNFALSVLTDLAPDVCKTPKGVSFALWIAGTIVAVIALELFQERPLPQALAP
jgi:membrane protease YdiL (CAAX protease family)